MAKTEETEHITVEQLTPDDKFLRYPNLAPVDLFSRKYMLLNEIMNTTNDRIYTNPFNLISLRPDMFLNIVERHKFFRCEAMELDISVTAPVSMSGYLVAWWTPAINWGLDHDLPSNDSRLWSRAVDWNYWIPQDCATLALSDSESVQMTIPWVWPAYVLETRTTPHDMNPQPSLSAKLASMGRLHIQLVSAHQVDQTTPSITVRLLARYIKPYLAGPRLKQASNVLNEPTETRHERQSGYVSAGTQAYGMYSAAKLAYDNVGGTKGIKEGVSMATSTFEEVKPYVEAAYCAVVGCDDDPEQKTSTLSGQDGSHISVRQNVWGDTSRCKPDVNLLKLGTGPSQVAPSHYTGTLDEIDIYALCKRWCYQGHYDYDMSTRPVLGAKVTPISSMHGWLRFFNNFFRLWRGTIRYRFKCFGSPLVTYQVSVAVNFDNNQEATSNNFDRIGDVFTKMVTVRGTTSFDVDVPYIRESLWSRTDMHLAPQINFTAFEVGTHSGSNNNIPLPVLVFVAAGDDFQFASLRSGATSKYNPPDVLPIRPNPPLMNTHVKQGLIDHTATTTTVNEADGGPLQGGWTGTLRDIISRPSRREVSAWKLPPGQLFLNNNFGVSNVIDSMDNFDLISSLFLFYSGSYDIKAEFPEEGTSTDQATFLADMGGRASSNNDFSTWKGGHGVYRTDTTTWKFIEARVPYVSPWPMFPLGTEVGLVSMTGFQVFNPFTNDLAVTEMTGDTSPIPANDYFISAGPDFALHYLQPPWPSFIFANRDEYIPTMLPLPPPLVGRR